MATKDERAAVATAIRAVVPTGWAVYASPPSSFSAPCLILGPGEPYREPHTYRRERLQLRATVLVQVAAGNLALDVIDDALDDVLPAINALGDIAWERVTNIGEVTNTGGADYISAQVDIVVL